MRALIVLLVLLWSTPGLASAKKVQVEFDYRKDVELGSASLWMDGVRVCTEEPISSSSAGNYSFICNSVDIVAGAHNFAMTALVPTGETSSSSPEFPFYIELKVVEDFTKVIE